MAQLSNLIVNGVTRLLSKLYVSDSVTAPNFIGKLTGTAAKLGRNGDADTPMTFNWSGKDGQPTWLWGGENGSDMYVYNPSNFSVKNAKAAGSADSATKLSSSAGSATQPVYFNDGKPVATTYTLGKSVPASAVFTDTNTWRGVQNNLTSDATDQSLSAAQGKALKTLVDGKAAMGHTHNSIKDIGNKSSDTTFAYSKAGMSYTDYTWLAGWNGYELRAVNKGQFATAGHTHDASVLINNLSIGDSTPQDDDYYVSQYAGGGTTSTTYYRRPVKALWSYIKGKGDAIYQPKGSYAAASHTHTKAQVGLDNVDNTADANKSVKYATKAANADVAIGVADYNTPSKTIKIGYNGDGITGDAIKYIAGYTTGDGGSTTAKIKDVSKSALQSWLGLGNAAYTASSAYAASNHTHDDRYYTESEINTKLAGKADSGHIHLQGTESGKVDWNTLKTFGVYKIQSCTMTADYHAPVDEYAFGILQVLDSENGGSENRIIQIYWPHRTSQGAHLWYRMHNSSNMSDGWSNWTAITEKPATAGVADSASSVAWVNVTGKPSTFTPSSHTHNYAGSSSAGGAATSANKVNAALTINLNGTSQGAWDGSSAKSISITAASVGATSVTISRW